MQEPSIPATLLGLIRHYRSELGLSAIAALVAGMVHYQRREPGRQIFTEAVLAGVLGGASDHILTLFGVATSGSWGYVTAATVGYLGATTIFGFLGERLGLVHKPEPEHNEHDNQQ